MDRTSNVHIYSEDLKTYCHKNEDYQVAQQQAKVSYALEIW